MLSIQNLVNCGLTAKISISIRIEGPIKKTRIYYFLTFWDEVVCRLR